MSAPIQIEDRLVDSVDLKSFAFAIPVEVPGKSDQDEGARLRVDLKQGDSLLVKGGEAVTLKVLLSSLGVPDVSNDWLNPWDNALPHPAHLSQATPRST